MRKAAAGVGIALLVGLFAWQQARIVHVERGLSGAIDEIEGDGAQGQDTDSRVDSLTADMSRLEERISEAEFTTADDSERIELLRLHARDLGESVESLAGELGDLYGRMDDAEASVWDLQAAIDRLIEFVVLR